MFSSLQSLLRWPSKRPPMLQSGVEARGRNEDARYPMLRNSASETPTDGLGGLPGQIAFRYPNTSFIAPRRPPCRYAISNRCIMTQITSSLHPYVGPDQIYLLNRSYAWELIFQTHLYLSQRLHHGTDVWTQPETMLLHLSFESGSVWPM